jgi:hypothetical protein
MLQSRLSIAATGILNGGSSKLPPHYARSFACFVLDAPRARSSNWTVAHGKR